MKSTVTWTKNLQSVVSNGRGHQVVLDMPEAKNGDNQGPTAIELSAMSLAGCIVTIFAKIADKMRFTFSQLEFEMESFKTDDDPTFTKNEYVMRIKTDQSLEKVEKCLRLTLETCPVGVLFDKAEIPLSGEIIML